MHGQVGSSIEERILDGADESADFGQIGERTGPIPITKGLDLDQFNRVDPGAGSKEVRNPAGLGECQPGPSGGDSDLGHGSTPNA